MIGTFEITFYVGSNLVPFKQLVRISWSVKFDSTFLLEQSNALCFLDVESSFFLGNCKRLVSTCPVWFLHMKAGIRETGCPSFAGRTYHLSLERTLTGDATSFWEDYQGLREHRQFLHNLQARHSNSLQVQYDDSA